MFYDVPPEQLRDAVDAVADDLLTTAGIGAPPVDALAVARRLGIELVRDGRPATRARLVRLRCPHGRQDAIFLADEPRAERRHWAVAHEIGEWAASRVFSALGAVPTDAAGSAREHVANRLAGSLLLPSGWIVRDGDACQWDLLELKRIYATASHELIARRMLDQGPSIVVTLFDHGAPVWRRNNFQGRTPRVTDREQAVWSRAHEFGQPARLVGADCPPGVGDIRAWPVHEPGWKREILRTEVAEL